MSRNHILGSIALHDRAVALSYAMHFGLQLTGACRGQRGRVPSVQHAAGSRQTRGRKHAAGLQAGRLFRRGCVALPRLSPPPTGGPSCPLSLPPEDDLSALVLLSHSLSLRIPLGAPLSHAEALQHCKELAGKLLARSGEPQTLPLGAPPVTPLTCE